MPQNPTQVLVGLNSGSPKALAVDADGVLKVTPDTSQVSIAAANATGTIASTGVFQACLAANADRLPGGIISNNGTKAMALFVGAVADANADKSIPIGIGASLPLTTIFGPDQVYTGELAITGTATDKFSTVEISKGA